MTITSLDRASVKALSDSLNADLKALGAKYGVDMRLAGGTLISDSACKLNLEITLQGTDSVRSQRLAEDLKQLGAIYLPNIDLEKPIKHPRLGPIKIVGFNSRAHRTPVIAETLQGKRYRFETADIQRLAAA